MIETKQLTKIYSKRIIQLLDGDIVGEKIPAGDG